MKYDIILFDADDTLFDFQKTAERCFLETSALLGLPHEVSNYYLYRDINQYYWDLYALGKIDKPTILKQRFIDYGQKIGFEIDSALFAEIYEKKLSQTSIIYPETIQVISTLKQKGARLFIITNGTSHVQRGRIEISGIKDYFDDIFISDELKCSKPSKEYLDKVIASIDGFEKNRTLIVGDSLVSDIPLGIENGIDTCYLNHTDKQSPLPCTYEIKNLSEVLNII